MRFYTRDGAATKKIETADFTDIRGFILTPIHTDFSIYKNDVILRTDRQRFHGFCIGSCKFIIGRFLLLRRY